MQRLIDQGGFITDTQTGLDWQKATRERTWHQAMGTTNLVGWRMPDKYELLGLSEAAAAQPGLIPCTGVFWSSSEYDASNAWLVDFGDGSVDNSDRYYSFAVRLVRASQSLSIMPASPAPVNAPPLTLRQHFAIAATASGNLQGNPADLARHAWDIADALLAAERKRVYYD